MYAKLLVLVVCLGAKPTTGTAESPQPTSPRTQATQEVKASYFKVPIRGGIGSDFTAAYMKALIKSARRVGATTIVVELDTGGGSVVHAEAIVDLVIDNADMRFVAYVRRALSAGAPIALACEDIYMNPKATIGAAVSYRANAVGLPIELPQDVAEKHQSAWRAVCRKAAQHGGHNPLIAEAMVDPAFALTMVRKNGGAVLQRGGSGQLIKAENRILTLTAEEAVECGLAAGIVEDLSFVGDELTYRDSLLVQLPSGTDVNDLHGSLGSSALYRKVSEKVKALGLQRNEDSSLLQQESGKEELERWLDDLEQRFSRKPVHWDLVLVHASERYRWEQIGDTWHRDGPLLPYLEGRAKRAERRWREAKKRYNEAEGRSARENAMARAQQCRKEYWRWGRAFSEVRKFPYEVLARCPEFPEVLVLAYVSCDSEEDLLAARLGDVICLQAKLSQIYVLSTNGAPQVGVFLSEAVVQPSPDSLPLAQPAKSQPAGTAESDETQAAKRLQLARMYQANGMREKAVEVLASLIADFPDTEAAEEAKRLLRD
jgi:hypothetical protein